MTLKRLREFIDTLTDDDVIASGAMRYAWTNKEIRKYVFRSSGSENISISYDDANEPQIKEALYTFVQNNGAPIQKPDIGTPVQDSADVTRNDRRFVKSSLDGKYHRTSWIREHKQKYRTKKEMSGTTETPETKRDAIYEPAATASPTVQTPIAKAKPTAAKKARVAKTADSIEVKPTEAKSTIETTQVPDVKLNETQTPVIVSDPIADLAAKIRSPEQYPQPLLYPEDNRDEWLENNTGTMPKNGVFTPEMAAIYLKERDIFVEPEYIPIQIRHSLTPETLDEAMECGIFKIKVKEADVPLRYSHMIFTATVNGRTKRGMSEFWRDYYETIESAVGRMPTGRHGKRLSDAANDE